MRRAHSIDDRRGARRYPIQAELEYRIVRGGKLISSGRGHTIDISTGGILFRSASDVPSSDVPADYRVELAVVWPAQLSGGIDLQFCARGRTVRSDQNRTAVKIDRYEFRTKRTKGSPSSPNPGPSTTVYGL